MAEQMTPEAKELTEAIFKTAFAGRAVLGLADNDPDGEYARSVLEELKTASENGERFEGKTLRENVKEYVDKIENETEITRASNIADGFMTAAKNGEKFKGETLYENVKDYIEKMKETFDTDPKEVRARKVAVALYKIARAAKECNDNELLDTIREDLRKDLYDEGVINPPEEGELKN